MYQSFDEREPLRLPDPPTERKPWIPLIQAIVGSQENVSEPVLSSRWENTGFMNSWDDSNLMLNSYSWLHLEAGIPLYNENDPYTIQVNNHKISLPSHKSLKYKDQSLGKLGSEQSEKVAF
jgi:hypothetical protein